MLSQTTEYALRAVVHLARVAGDGPVRVDDVAEALSVPRNYLSKILHVLAREGLLESTRGPRGGFRLARAPETLALVDIVREFEVPDELGACLMGRPRCSDEDPCAAHARWKLVSRSVAEFFEKTTVADLAAVPGGKPHRGAGRAPPARPVPHPPEPPSHP